MSFLPLKDRFAALIAVPSVSCTQPALDQSNQPVIDLLANWLSELGFTCEKQQVEPGKFNLIATYGSGPGGLVLAGHSDTVPFDEALWQSDPLKLTDTGDRWVGLGVCDMKGFFALIIEALQAAARPAVQAAADHPRHLRRGKLDVRRPRVGRSRSAAGACRGDR